MKFISLLFSFYLLFLAFEPGFKAMSILKGQSTACCSDKKCLPMDEQTPEDDSDGHENSNACNPFQFCKCCSFINLDFNMAVDAPIIIFSNAHVSYKENVPPNTSLDFWQPPKLA